MGHTTRLWSTSGGREKHKTSQVFLHLIRGSGIVGSKIHALAMKIACKPSEIEFPASLHIMLEGCHEWSTYKGPATRLVDVKTMKCAYCSLFHFIRGIIISGWKMEALTMRGAEEPSQNRVSSKSTSYAKKAGPKCTYESHTACWLTWKPSNVTTYTFSNFQGEAKLLDQKRKLWQWKKTETTTYWVSSRSPHAMLKSWVRMQHMRRPCSWKGLCFNCFFGPIIP